MSEEGCLKIENPRVLSQFADQVSPKRLICWRLDPQLADSVLKHVWMTRAVSQWLIYRWTHNSVSIWSKVGVCWSRLLKVILFLVPSRLLCFASWPHEVGYFVPEHEPQRTCLTSGSHGAAMDWNHETRQTFPPLTLCLLNYCPQQWKSETQSPTRVPNYT